jgi:hypothetical protein
MPTISEVLVVFDEPVESDAGTRYVARVVGAVTPLGQWEGWLEFTPAAGGASLTTDRETTQPNRADLAYWASGLSRVYLQGALNRALSLDAPPVARVAPVEPAAAYVGTPVLDPFAVYAQGENILRRQLHAVSLDQLRTIVRAYGLGPVSLDAPDVVEEIVATVRRIVQR